MSRYRVEFSKGPEARFISHLELMKAIQRAMRRAKLPLAYSEGFNPHPKMAFASAIAVGVTSDKEYMDLELREDLAAQEVLTRLKGTLPPGLIVLDCKEVPQKLPALMAIVEAAEYEVRIPLLEDITREQVEKGIAELLAQDSIVIEKLGKKGPQKKELRPGIYNLECKSLVDGRAVFLMRLKSGSNGNIRPDEVLKSLKEIAFIPVDLDLAVIHRTGLFISRQGQLVSPME